MIFYRTFLSLSILTLTVPIFATNKGAKLEYTVNLQNTKSHTVHVRVDVQGFTAKKASYQMPVWAPGAYSVSHYGHYVNNFQAFDKNHKPLAVNDITGDRWEMPGTVHSIEYDVLDSHKDSTSLYFAMANFDTSIVFANGTALFGYFDDDKSAASNVSYLLPDQWKLACPLDPVSGYKAGRFDLTKFRAKNYDELADAPVLAAQTQEGDHADHIITSSFKEGPANYDVAVVTDGTFSAAKMDSLEYYLRRIVQAETDFFHDTPYKHYTFEIVAPTFSHMPSFAQGALEHANSSDYLLADFGWSMFKSNFLSIFSHEFFHLWNVKRIHSNLLGPFDYTQRVMTTSLWMAEGITEYYAHTLLARYGIETPERFYADIRQWQNEMAMSPPANGTKSLEQLSIDESDFNLDEATLFYTRGPLVALMLDIEIRERTNNKHSLDDVMRVLNKDAQHGKTFREEDLIKKVNQYAGCDLTGFYNKYIHGTDSLPLGTYLAKMGISIQSEAPPKPKVQFSTSGDSGIVFILLDTSSAYAKAGIHEGDIVVAVNGKKFSNADFMEITEPLEPKESGSTVTLTVVRNGHEVPMTVDIPAMTKSPETGNHREMQVGPTAPPIAVAIRKGIVGS